MLYLNLAQIIHRERQAEIERTLKVRRLMERIREAKAAPTRTAAIAAARQTSAGAAS
jgi:hypothetical protein